MKIEKLPTKLASEPLVDALCEVRFTTVVPASTVLPGLLFKELGGGPDFRLEPLPTLQIPPEVRQSEPQLQFAPLFRILWEGFAINVGDSLISVSIVGTYPGWSNFKTAIVKVMKATVESGVVEKIDRYSIKYVDLISFGAGQLAGGLDLRLKLGEVELRNQIAQVRMEVPDHPYIHIIQALTNAQATLATGETRSGSVVDVDTIASVHNCDPAKFIEDLPTSLDEAHVKNKQIFFECLSTSTLTMLGPIYE